MERKPSTRFRFVNLDGSEPHWFMSKQHMNPEEAVQAYGDVAAVHRDQGWALPAMVPNHWGTFKLSDEPIDEPPRRLTEAWTAAGQDAQSLWLLKHGETRARALSPKP